MHTSLQVRGSPIMRAPGQAKSFQESPRHKRSDAARQSIPAPMPSGGKC